MLALDYEWINQKLYYGERTRARSYWPGTILSVAGLPSADESVLLSRFRESLPGELFQQPFDFPGTDFGTSSVARLNRSTGLPTRTAGGTTNPRPNESRWIVDGLFRFGFL